MAKERAAIKLQLFKHGIERARLKAYQEKINSCNKNRVRTDFWIQNSRLFPDFFKKKKIYFSTLEVIKRGINSDLKKYRTKVFLRCTGNVRARL